MKSSNFSLWFLVDPFVEPQSAAAGPGEGHIHIRIQQRNGRKTLTTVQGIGDQYDKKKIVKVCKKVSFVVYNYWTVEVPATVMGLFEVVSWA